MKRATLSGLALAAALAGCASAPQIAEQAVEANLAVEQAHNRILLLNVVRAYHDRPLHFTSLEQLFGPLGRGRVRGGFSLPFGPGGWSDSVLSLNAEPQAPGFNVAVHDSRAFMRGFLSPVRPALLGHYLRQRWPTERLLNLFVHEIRIVDADGRTRRRYLNDPRSPDALREFQRLAASLATCEIGVEARREKQPYGPVIAVTDLSQLVSAKRAHVLLEPVGDASDPHAYQAFLYRDHMRLSMDGAAGPACAGIADDRGLALREGAFHFRDKDPDKEENGRRPPAERTVVPQAPAQRAAVFTLRSPEGMVHYLGQLARAQNEARRPRDAAAAGAESAAPLFALLESGDPLPPGQASLQVSYEGRSYAVPRDNGSAMSALSLVSQVIGLQKEATELPGVGTFRAIP